MSTFAYLHGFASGPGSRKAVAFASSFGALGIEVAVPSLDEGNFRDFTLSRARAVVDRMLAAAARPTVLFGSSMGGYLALLHAASHPVDALVLMAPAVDFERRWRTRLTPDELAAWVRDGERLFFHYGAKRPLPLAAGFLDDLAAHDPWPRTDVPTLVIQGLRDDVVQPETTRRWVRENPSALLVELDADHELGDVVPALLEHARRFLASVPAVARAVPAPAVDTSGRL